MATYIVPQTLVFQDFNLVPVAFQTPLRAHIAGGHAFLIRHSVPAEKEAGFLGYYDDQQNSCYTWPNRPAGGFVDSSYTKLFIDNALLKYFEDSIGAGANIKTVVGYGNRVRAATINFADNGAAYPRSVSVLPSRDVQIGDVARLRAVVGGTEHVWWTNVAGIVGDVVAPIVGAASVESTNAANQSADVTSRQIAGAINCVDIVDIDASDYDGTISGRLIETYRIRVTRSSVGQNLATAKLRVTSASGTDDVSEVSPATDGTLPVGTRGLLVTFGEPVGGNCSLSASLRGVAADDLLLGQEWEVTVRQAWTRPTVASGGTYTGDQNCSYIVTVIEGGRWAVGGQPRVRVTTDTGVDLVGATAVPASGVAIPVGSRGVTITFTGNGLNKGDTYYIPVTAAKAGNMKTLVFSHNHPQGVLAANTGGGVEVDLSLYIRKATVEIPAQRPGNAAIYNWVQSDTEICVNAGVTAYDASWTVGGIPQALPVIAEASQGYGKLYVEYRAWLPVFHKGVYGVSDIGSLDTYITGPLHPDNPLKWGVYKALQNSGGTEVKFTSVADPSSVDSWLDVLALLEDRNDIFGLVPLTKNPVVLNAYQAHVQAASTPERGRWRAAWFNAEGPSTSAVVNETTSSDKLVVRATITDDPATSGTQYTLVNVAPSGTSPNGKFVTNGVRPGDILRFNYSSDAFGNIAYEEYVVDAVLGEDSLRLVSGPPSANPTPRKIEIWRNMSTMDIAQAVEKAAGAWGSRWVRFVWPDTIEGDGQTMEGYYLCAALAALASGVVPHQSLTRLEIAGFTAVPRSTMFNRTQLDVMASAGTWIVTQAPNGNIYTRHALTTGDPTDANSRDEMRVRNISAISYYIFDVLDPFIGVANITPDSINNIRNLLETSLRTLQSANYVTRLGPQVVDFTVQEIRPHLVLVNRLVITLTLTLPFVMDNIEVHLVA